MNKKRSSVGVLITFVFLFIICLGINFQIMNQWNNEIKNYIFLDPAKFLAGPTRKSAIFLLNFPKNELWDQWIPINEKKRFNECLANRINKQYVFDESLKNTIFLSIDKTCLFFIFLNVFVHRRTFVVLTKQRYSTTFEGNTRFERPRIETTTDEFVCPLDYWMITGVISYRLRRE